jgi:hypothetical protein
VIQIAHAGHWLPQLLYLAPVLVMVGAVGLGKLREKRNRNESESKRRGRC